MKVFLGICNFEWRWWYWGLIICGSCGVWGVWDFDIGERWEWVCYCWCWWIGGCIGEWVWWLSWIGRKLLELEMRFLIGYLERGGGDFDFLLLVIVCIWGNIVFCWMLVGIGICGLGICLGCWRCCFFFFYLVVCEDEDEV